MKKWIPILFAVVLAVSLLAAGTVPVSAADASGTCGENLTWELTGSKLTISGTGAMYDYSQENPAPWADYKDTVTTLRIGEEVSSIGDYAFYGFSSLDYSVIIPKSVNRIGKWAFAGCSEISGFTIYTKPLEIEEGTFAGCSSITSMTLSGNLSRIGRDAFKDCTALNQVYIGSQVQYVEDGAFSGCAALSLVRYYGTQQQWEGISVGAQNESFLSAKLYVTGGYCGEAVQWKLSNDILTVFGTGSMADYSIENPAPWFEQRTDIKQVVIEEGITRLGDYAFYNLTNTSAITIPASVTEIGEYALSIAAGRRSIYFWGGAPNISDTAFSGMTGNALVLGGWTEEAKLNYGGTLTWVTGELKLHTDTKKLYAIDEAILATDFIITAYYPDVSSKTYAPRKTDIGEYDNSSLGYKTVAVTVDGVTLTNEYFVTDGTSHFELVRVDYPAYRIYKNGGNIIEPVITAGGMQLEKGVHYLLSYENTGSVGMEAKMIVTGRGIFEGYSSTHNYAIVRRDIADADITAAKAAYMAASLTPELTVKVDGTTLTAGTDYIALYESNVNIGTATVKVIGIGNYCGYAIENFQITTGATSITLPGVYNGKDPDLSDEIYIWGGAVSPGTLHGTVYTAYPCTAVYVLYKVEGEESTLITQIETEHANASKIPFTYDFSSVYNSTAEEGYETYVLLYSYKEYDNDVYTGALTMMIPAKAPDAQTMVLNYATEDGNFRYEYLAGASTDGHLGTPGWSTSDASIATVANGVVRFKTPGTVTIAGEYNGLTASQQITAKELDITQGALYAYSAEEGAVVIYDGELLISGTDYTVSTAVQGDMTEVTVTGCGLFTGQLIRQFNTATGEGAEHTHGFSAVCDTTCNSCDFTRAATHPFSTEWDKDMTSHWHACTVCGEKGEVTEHTLSSADPNTCTVCGALYTPGDVNGDGRINTLDGLLLLRYLNDWDVTIASSDAMDVNGDSKVSSVDGLILMRYLNGWNVTLG